MQAKDLAPSILSSGRYLEFTNVCAPSDERAMLRIASLESLPAMSPQGRPLKFLPGPGARFLCQVPFAELPVGKRVHSLNTDWRGTIVEHGDHRGDATVSIDWDNGNKSPGVFHFVLDTVAEDVAS